MYKNLKLYKKAVLMIVCVLCFVFVQITTQASATPSSLPPAKGEATVTFYFESESSSNGSGSNKVDKDSGSSLEKPNSEKAEVTPSVKGEMVLVTNPDGTFPENLLPLTGSNDKLVMGLTMLAIFSLLVYFASNKRAVFAQSEKGGGKK